MRRLPTVAWLLMLALLPVMAQRGGGHFSAGGHGGGMAAHGSFGGHASGGQAIGGMHSGAGSATHGFNRGPAFPRRGLSSRNSFRNFNRFRRPIFRDFAFRGRRGWGWPVWGGYYDPWWWDSGSSYDPDRQQEIGLANEMNAQSLEEQRMRNEQDQDLYARSAPPPPHQEERTEAAPATLLVFRDQHKKEVQNYAIVGQTLWNFAPQRTEKILLADLDIAATTKANDERGVDFRLPGGNEGQ
ncbi:MAG: hypothetical protein WB562_13235 [Candidatus Sulfotelmatobacter sp.]